MVELLFRPMRVSARRARLVCTVAAVVACALLGASAFWSVRAWYVTGGRDQWLLALSSGTLSVSWTSADFETDGEADDATGLSFEADSCEDHSVSLAWRPYHLGVRGGFRMDDLYHGVAVPLWLVALPAAAGAAYLQGRAVVRRRTQGH